MSMTICPSFEYESKQLVSAFKAIFVFSTFIFALGCLFGHVGSGLPSANLGIRPRRSSWFRYLSNHLGFGVGVKGYDSSLGAYSPTIRLLYHVAFILFFWSILILFRLTFKAFLGAVFDTEVCPNVDMANIVGQVQDTGLFSLICYCLGFFLNWIFSKGVSNPGPSRAHKIQRVPRWNSRVTFAEGDEGVRWHCAVSEESHKITHERFKNVEKVMTARLTGEAYGRQVWSWNETGCFEDESKSSFVDEKIVEKMAYGGRERGFDPSKNPNSCDIIFRSQQIKSYIATGKSPPDCNSSPKTASDAARKGAHFYSMLQTEDGHWAGDYGGPHFLLPSFVITWYIIGQPSLMLDKHQCNMMKHYLVVHQQADGGWGTHIESPSTMFGTVLCYVSLRLLGLNPDDEVCEKGRKFIRDEGGAVMTSSWAKFWLCILGCMEWKG